jgi:hypothetical protein
MSVSTMVRRMQLSRLREQYGSEVRATGFEFDMAAWRSTSDTTS